MVDIIIRAKNGHDMTKACVRSIRDNTSAPDYRIILVDDGSEPAYMPSDADVLVRSSESKGAVTATNLGLAVALQDLSRPYVVILDNDTAIPDGDVTWLERFISALEEDDKIACVGATTNYANWPQDILRAPFTYTAEWTDQHDKRKGGKVNPEVPWFVSFGCLLRKQAIAYVGFFDERYNPGNWEDTDYAMQLRTQGWKVKVAQSVYIHHLGSQTFSDKWADLMRVNGERFHAKWGNGRLYDMGMLNRQEMLRVLQ